EGPHARRWAAGRFHSAYRNHARPAAQASCRQPDAAVLARSSLKEETTDVARQTLYGCSRHDDLRRRQVARRLSSEPVLHVADEGGEPCALQGERARLSR